MNIIPWIVRHIKLMRFNKFGPVTVTNFDPNTVCYVAEFIIICIKTKWSESRRSVSSPDRGPIRVHCERDIKHPDGS